MTYNGKEYEVGVRTDEENKEVIEQLERAKDCLSVANFDITYSSFKELNSELKDNINNLSDAIDDILIALENGSMEIYKPVKIERR